MAADDCPVTHDAWTIVLGFIAERSLGGVALISRLLCCSSSMASLIHTVCAGRLDLVLVSKERRKPEKYERDLEPWADHIQQEARVWQEWLAKFGSLLNLLYIHVWPEQEQYIAAGLKAAAELEVEDAAAKASPESPAQPLDTASDTPDTASDDESSVLGLQLSGALFGAPPSPELLSSVACETLGLLTYQCSENPSKEQQQAAVLSQLTSLEELTLITPLDISYCTQEYSATFKAISGLTELTRLRFATIDDKLNQAMVDLLPVSLKELWTFADGSATCFTHLTNLEQLSLDVASPGLTLPPSTTHLELKRCKDVAPLLTLQHLKSLHIYRLV
jgi:hypothetical protein